MDPDRGFLKTAPLVFSHIQSPRRARVARPAARRVVVVKERVDGEALINCLVQDTEGSVEGHLNESGIVNAPGS